MKIDNVNKRCSGCGETKLRTQFPRRKSCKDGPGEFSGTQAQCTECYRIRSISYRQRNPEKARQAIRDCVARNPERAWRIRLQTALKTLYGITLADFDAMWENQKGCCAICDRVLKPLGEFLERPCVDHCHTTGKVRGILCNLCNQGLGRFQDKPVLLQRAIAYLEENALSQAPTD